MEYKIEEMASFRVVGYAIETSNEEGRGMVDIPAFWGDVIAEGKQIDVVKLMDQPPFGLLGLCHYNTNLKDNRIFKYYIGASSKGEVREGMDEMMVPAFTWAVFPCASREKIHEVEVAIVVEWQPQSGYNLVNKGYHTGEMEAPAPDITVYNEDGSIEVWVAVTKQ